MVRIPPKAQASIEFMTIMVLVVTGIVLMGPYVLRSINAHFKSVDDQVTDSFEEKIYQSNEIDFQLPGCSCSDLTKRGCGPSGSSGFCTNDFERYYARSCTPIGCENDPRFNIGTLKECIVDSTCCSPWANDKCGKDGGIGPTPPGLLCGGEEMAQVHTCDTDGNPLTPPITIRRCLPAPLPPITCAYACEPAGLAPGSFECPNAYTGLTADTPRTIVSGLTCETFPRPGDIPPGPYTWNRPNNFYQAVVRVWGAGGRGGGRNGEVGNDTVAGGGGGGGAYAEGLFALSGSTFTVTVGKGGDDTLINGGTSIFLQDAILDNPLTPENEASPPTTLIAAGGGTGRTETQTNAGPGSTVTVNTGSNAVNTDGLDGTARVASGAGHNGGRGGDNPGNPPNAPVGLGGDGGLNTFNLHGCSTRTCSLLVCTTTCNAPNPPECTITCGAPSGCSVTSTTGATPVCNTPVCPAPTTCASACSSAACLALPPPVTCDPPSNCTTTCTVNSGPINNVDCPPNRGSDGSVPGGGGGGGSNGSTQPNGSTIIATGGLGGAGRVDICVGNGILGCTGAKCEIYCPPPYLPDVWGTLCVVQPPKLFTVATQPCAGQKTTCTNNQSREMCNNSPPANVTNVAVFPPGVNCNIGSGPPEAVEGSSCWAVLW